jgi:hypothetical protein
MRDLDALGLYTGKELEPVLAVVNMIAAEGTSLRSSPHLPRLLDELLNLARVTAGSPANTVVLREFVAQLDRARTDFLAGDSAFDFISRMGEATGGRVDRGEATEHLDRVRRQR